MTKQTTPDNSQSQTALITESIERRKDPNSEAARFDKAMAAQQTQEEAARSTKEEMLGADLTSFTRRRDTDDVEVTFFPRPPKLGALPELMYEISVASLDTASQVELIFVIATTFLYVYDPQLGHRRRATADEIKQCVEFGDMDMLQEMTARYTGMVMDKVAASKK